MNKTLRKAERGQERSGIAKGKNDGDKRFIKLLCDRGYFVFLCRMLAQEQGQRGRQSLALVQRSITEAYSAKIGPQKSSNPSPNPVK